MRPLFTLAAFDEAPGVHHFKVFCDEQDMRLNRMQGLIAAALAFCSPFAMADGSASGKISRLDAVASLAGAPGNADTRVYLAGATTFCDGAVTDATWAFVNSNDANCKGVLSTLLLAYGTNKTITVNARAVSVGSGLFCQITWVNVLG